MRTELFHLSTNPQRILPTGGRILTIYACNLSSTTAEIEITVETNVGSSSNSDGPNSTLIKRSIQTNTTLSILANKDDQLRLNSNQNITAQCNSGQADIIVAWIGSSNSDPQDSSSGSSSSTCVWGSTCPDPIGGGGSGSGGEPCQNCQCFKLVTLNCTPGSSSGSCECTEGQETWVKCEDCPDSAELPTTCESSITYCTGESKPCCGDKCNTSGPNSDDEMCPEGEKCCGVECCPKDGECCPDGKCPTDVTNCADCTEQHCGWICCPDGIFCAATLADCPPATSSSS